jgi:DnaJ-class molecular chaperone
MDNLDKNYQILGLQSGVTKEEIKKAYRKLAKQFHPDFFLNNPEAFKQAQIKFQQINEAYEILKDHDLEIPQNLNREDIKVSITTNQAQIYYNLGVIEAEEENWEAAIEYFSQAIKIDDTFIKAYYYRASIFDKQGFELRANQDWNKIKELKFYEQYNKNSNQSNYNNKNRRSTRQNYRKNRIIYKNKQNLLIYSIICMFIVVVFIVWYLS